MSALAHYLEEEGLSTTLIGLIRNHVERIQPPRALWVPFELGRPVGPPNNPDFQKRVIEAALALLDREDGPVILEDFPEDAPGEEDGPNWRPPPLGGAADVAAEISALAPAHAAFTASNGFSNVGLTGVDVGTLAQFIARIDSDEPMERPTTKLAPVQVLRFGADDIKAYYAEAAVSSGGSPSSAQVWGWFWRETQAGALIWRLRHSCMASENASRQGIARSLVPVRWQEDEAVLAKLA